MQETTSLLDQFRFNEEGFLLDLDRWTPELAQAIADDEGITLTDRHWVVINFARSEFAKHGDGPTIRKITKSTDVTMREIYKLFPNGPAKQAAMIAGIPKPTGCI